MSILNCQLSTVSRPSNPIGIFDSGAGGLTVLKECRALLPAEDFIYYADNANVPYGNKPREIIERLTADATKRLIGYGVKAIVLACNTATAASAAALRARYNIPVIGLEPALKPAARYAQGGKVLVLATEATVKREKFARLLKVYGNGNTLVAPQKDLARLIEENLDDLSVLEAKAERAVAPHRENLKAVVLGCTHYIFIKEYLQRAAGPDVAFFDGNAGTARQLRRRLEENGLLKGKIIPLCGGVPQTGGRAAIPTVPPTISGKITLLSSGVPPPSYWTML
ncbi:glutamate racemase [Clostridia bacterium]|nr:glutamate racemase [Clostridia bacterium]